jgi:hypothetical protein
MTHGGTKQNGMKRISDEQLMAYTDGELGELDAKRVEKAISGNNDMAAKLEGHRQLKAALDNAFSEIDDAPLPEGIADLLETAKTVDPIGTARAKRAWLKPVIGSVPAQIAAVFLVAVGLVWQFPQLTNGGSGSRELASANSGIGTDGVSDVLAAALDALPRGSEMRGSDGIVIGASYMNGKSELCRTFEKGAGQKGAQTGLACRNEGDHWSLIALVPSLDPKAAIPEGAFLPAGHGPTGAKENPAIEALLATMRPIGKAEEKALLEANQQ